MLANPLTMHSDTRIGNKPRYFLAPPEEKLDMRVPDEFRQCTVFLARDNKSNLEFTGSAFFISVRSTDPALSEYGSFYLVTARHVIDNSGENILFRANIKDGTSEFFSTKRSNWYTHPTDSSIDVAVLPVRLSESIDFKHLISDDVFLTDEVVEEKKIGAGDEVFLTGLFAKLQGNKRNIPIVRMGNIAMMPDDPVYTLEGEISAYLIEVRSIGGLSGSPVFVRETVKIGPGPFYLMGLMHGHWDLPLENKNDFIDATRANNAVNMGIAIVVPANKILEVLNQKELVDMRKKSDEENRKKQMPVPDTVQREALTVKGFEKILGRVSRPLPNKPAEGESKR